MSVVGTLPPFYFFSTARLISMFCSRSIPSVLVRSKFFRQKTKTSDWKCMTRWVCTSPREQECGRVAGCKCTSKSQNVLLLCKHPPHLDHSWFVILSIDGPKIGRASCRERV